MKVERYIRSVRISDILHPCDTNIYRMIYCANHKYLTKYSLHLSCIDKRQADSLSAIRIFIRINPFFKNCSNSGFHVNLDQPTKYSALKNDIARWTILQFAYRLRSAISISCKNVHQTKKKRFAIVFLEFEFMEIFGDYINEALFVNAMLDLSFRRKFEWLRTISKEILSNVIKIYDNCLQKWMAKAIVNKFKAHDQMHIDYYRKWTSKTV